jgi:hypothetical protein
MNNRPPPSAAEALFPNLKTGTPSIVERLRDRNPSIADAVYAHLRPPPSSPPSAPKPYREPEVSLAQACDEKPWLEYGLALSGLRRIK